MWSTGEYKYVGWSWRFSESRLTGSTRYIFRALFQALCHFVATVEVHWKNRLIYNEVSFSTSNKLILNSTRFQLFSDFWRILQVLLFIVFLVLLVIFDVGFSRDTIKAAIFLYVSLDFNSISSNLFIWCLAEHRQFKFPSSSA